MSDEHGCRRMTVGRIRALATVSASSGRGSVVGRMERGTQPGWIARERGTRFESKSLANWVGAALAVTGCRTTVALERSEEQRHGRRLSDEHRCRRTIGVGITLWATVRAGRGSGQGRRRARGARLGWIGSETVPATWVGEALARMGAGVCQTAVASPTAAIVVTITTATVSKKPR